MKPDPFEPSDAIMAPVSPDALAAGEGDAANPWRLALESSGAGVWDCNLVTGRQTHSPRWKAILGYSERDAGAALKLLPADVGVSEGIKLALKSLSR